MTLHLFVGVTDPFADSPAVPPAIRSLSKAEQAPMVLHSRCFSQSAYLALQAQTSVHFKTPRRAIRGIPQDLPSLQLQ